MPKSQTYHCGYCGKELIPTPTQKAMITRGFPVYCRENNNACYKAAHRERQKERYRNGQKERKPVTCHYRYCSNVFMPPNNRTYLYCPGTNHAYLETLERQKGKQYKKRKKVEKSNGRKCKVCGQNPYPNYYFCPPCHAKVGSNDVDDWHTWDAVKVA